jgi:hypothetical protein
LLLPWHTLRRLLLKKRAVGGCWHASLLGTLFVGVSSFDPSTLLLVLITLLYLLLLLLLWHRYPIVHHVLRSKVVA